jgi:molybdate transport system substrate-binding protein
MFRRLLALAAVVVGLSVAPARAEAPILVFAAASMKTALEAGAERFTADTGRAVTFSFGASGTLARQLDQGAPADVFVSADVRWMEHAAEQGTIDPGTRRILAGNALVLVMPADSTARFEAKPGSDLAALIRDGRLAIGEPRSVPAGAYAMEALRSLGFDAAVEGRLAPVESVRAALALVASGEAPAGIVYATDARAEPRVRVVAVFPESSHAPIVYPAAVTASSADPAGARAFLDWLSSDAGRATLEAEGFLPPAP